MIEITGVTKYYGTYPVLKNCSTHVSKGEVVVVCGPSGSGKSTLIKCVNALEPIQQGSIKVDGIEVNDPATNLPDLRSRVGMVFQKPNPFPKSIFDNVAYGPRIHGLAHDRTELEAMVQTSLDRAGLWAEVKDRLTAPALALSGGQQQRLCIARAIAVQPEVILMDEPCSALDPIATQRIEELIGELRAGFTIVIVTHNMQQALRVAGRTAFFHLGEMVEQGATRQIFSEPADERTRGFVFGRFG